MVRRRSRPGRAVGTLSRAVGTLSSRAGGTLSRTAYAGPVPLSVPADARVVAVVGPTAAGKSDLGVDLALALGGEVLNADSMQLYRGMDVGTAKLTPAERRGVPHHLLDVLPVTAPASAADYQRDARAVLEDCLARGVVPVVVGGSGLYVRALLDELVFPGTDPALRACLEAELAASGPATLHARLARLDPVAAGLMDPANGRRVVRALEVVTLTGRPMPAAMTSYAARYPTLYLGVDPGVEALDARLEARVDAMLAGGLVEEVRALDAVGLRDGVTASRALGYAQVLRVLDGEWELAAARDDTVRRTRRLARRQRGWFRRDPRVRWSERPHPVDEVVRAWGDRMVTQGHGTAGPVTG